MFIEDRGSLGSCFWIDITQTTPLTDFGTGFNFIVAQSYTRADNV